MKKRLLSFVLTLLVLLGSMPFYTQAASLPGKYDLRKLGFVTPVRSQKDYGLCWAFAACAAMESNALVQGLGRYNLSEVHLAYFALCGVTHPLPGLEGDVISFAGDSPWYEYGGYSGIATSFLMCGYGPVSESLAPLSMLPKHPSEKLAYGHNVLTLTGTQEIPASDQNAMKRTIMKNGAIVCGTNLAFDNKRFFNKKTGALFVNVKKVINHDMVIVGWDDNYSRNNFAKVKPKRNGAWLCKNCWGKKWGNSGYFWLSYEDVPSSDDTCFSYIMSPGSPGTIYQYDAGYGSYGYDDSLGMANVYTTRQQSELFLLSAYLEPCTGTFFIYQNPTGTPDSGTLLYSQQFRVDTRGYSVFSLPDLVTLEKGTRFSVVFTFNEPCFAPIDYDDIGSWFVNSDITAHEGESYIYQEAEGWQTDDSFNCRIKVYARP